MLENYTIDGFENIQYQGYPALQKIENNLGQLELYGYHPISTPTFEAYDLYAAEDSIASDDLFKLVNHQGRCWPLSLTLRWLSPAWPPSITTIPTK